MPWEGDKNMKRSFTDPGKALLTVMLQCATPEIAIGKIRNALCEGAEAFGLQAESLEPQYQNPSNYRRLFDEMRGCPSYVTNYRHKTNEGKSDEELAQGLLTLAESGADLCDVMTDYFDPQPGEYSIDPEAVKKQMALIEAIHEKGSQVIMSTHVMKFTPAERVLEIALEQQRRGADVVKIVVGAENVEQEVENLRIATLLKEKLDVPFLFLCGGECSILRRLGWKLGCGMILCVYEHDAYSTFTQPLLRIAKQVRDDLGF